MYFLFFDPEIHVDGLASLRLFKSTIYTAVVLWVFTLSLILLFVFF